MVRRCADCQDGETLPRPPGTPCTRFRGDTPHPELPRGPPHPPFRGLPRNTPHPSFRGDTPHPET